MTSLCFSRTQFDFKETNLGVPLRPSRSAVIYYRTYTDERFRYYSLFDIELSSIEMEAL